MRVHYPGKQAVDKVVVTQATAFRRSLSAWLGHGSRRRGAVLGRWRRDLRDARDVCASGAWRQEKRKQAARKRLLRTSAGCSRKPLGPDLDRTAALPRDVLLTRMATPLAEILPGPDGPLARALPGYKARPQQIEMAEQVAAALQERLQLVVEAGTGTGKTFAYLVPARCCRVARSSFRPAPAHYRIELFHRDLPTICAAIGRPVRIALLKGRANYLCRHRLGHGRATGLCARVAQGSRDCIAQGSRLVVHDEAGRRRGVARHRRAAPCGRG